MYSLAVSPRKLTAAAVPFFARQQATLHSLALSGKEKKDLT